jgi:hypothetical protein
MYFKSMIENDKTSYSEDLESEDISEDPEFYLEAAEALFAHLRINPDAKKIRKKKNRATKIAKKSRKANRR